MAAPMWTMTKRGGRHSPNGTCAVRLRKRYRPEICPRLFGTAKGLEAWTLTATDINGVVTTQRHDALGRLTAVWMNSRNTGQPANKKFTYNVSNTGLSWTTTQELNDSSGYRTSTLIYDALLRALGRRRR